MDDVKLPKRTVSEQSKPLSVDGCEKVVPPKPHFVPNRVPLTSRIWNITLSVTLFVYGTYGVATDNFVLPAKRGKTLALYGYPAWIMYLALLCLVANLAAVVIDHYDTRENERKYRIFQGIVRWFGWTFFVLALFLGVAKHNQDFVCENRETLRATNTSRRLAAVAFYRYCGLHSPSNAVEPSFQVTVVPLTSALPNEVGNTAHMNKTDIVRMYWNGSSLVLEYIPREGAKRARANPTPMEESPVPVQFVNMSPHASGQGTKYDSATHRP